VPSEGGRKLVEVLNWNNPDKLVEDYIADVKDASYGYCNYKIVERIEVDLFPVKADGFSYTGDSFIEAWRARGGFHQPDWVDYDRIMQDFNLVEKVNADQIDEVWLFAFPYGGFYESRMTGPDAFWCNAPPLKGYEHAKSGLSLWALTMSVRWASGIAGDLFGVFEHGLVPIVDRRRPKVAPDRRDEVVVGRHPAQELRMRHAAIRRAVGDRHDRGNHLVLAARERQIRRHELAERRKGMVQGAGNQRVRRHDAGDLIVLRQDGRVVFRRIQGVLGGPRLPQLFGGLIGADRADSGHYQCGASIVSRDLRL
jgi:hypothetical protein